MNHQPTPKWLRMTTIFIVALGLIAAITLYIVRGYNEIVFSDLPKGAEVFYVDRYVGCGSLDQEAYPIENGRVVMEWNYAIKTSYMRYRILGDEETLAEGEHEFGPHTQHELEL